MLIDLFVNSVTVYDDDTGYFKIITAYNLSAVPTKTYRVSTSFVEAGSSDTGPNGPPLDANPNTITVVGMVFVQTKRHALP